MGKPRPQHTTDQNFPPTIETPTRLPCRPNSRLSNPQAAIRISRAGATLSIANSRTDDESKTHSMHSPLLPDRLRDSGLACAARRAVNAAEELAPPQPEQIAGAPRRVRGAAYHSARAIDRDRGNSCARSRIPSRFPSPWSPRHGDVGQCLSWPRLDRAVATPADRSRRIGPAA